MIRKDALCFPAEILTAPSTRLVANQCKVSVDMLIVAYIRMLDYCREHPMHDLSAMANDEVWAITGIAMPSAFREYFFLPGGRLRYFDEYMMPGIKERGGAARRQKAFRERRKSPDIPPVKARKRPVYAINPDALFEAAWKAYPARDGGNPKQAALKAWNARVKAGVNQQEMLDAVVRYAAYCDATKRTGTPYVLQAQTFFGRDERWKDSWNIPERVAEADDTLDNILTEVQGAYAQAV